MISFAALVLQESFPQFFSAGVRQYVPLPSPEVVYVLDSASAPVGFNFDSLHQGAVVFLLAFYLPP